MQSATGSPNRKRHVVGTALITLCSILLLESAMAKLAHVPAVVNQLAAVGFSPHKIVFVAMLEITGSLIFLIPSTRSIGLLLVSAFLGGAIATPLQPSQSIAGPSVILVLIWLGAWLRHPEVLRSWQPGHVAKPAMSPRPSGSGSDTD